MQSIVKAILVAAAVVSALPATQLDARQAGTSVRTLVPGLPYTGATPPARKEIRSMSATELNIYYLALEAMQALPTTDMKSYYRIAGIHGTNYRWDGDSGGQFPDLTYGFCRHADRAFPPWHRPYLSLYEKVLYDLAKDAINKWPAGAQKDDHVKVLANWRIPYWDWAADPSIPAIMGGTAASESVKITKVDKASGKFGTYTVHNPVFSYKFPKEDDNGVNRIVTSGRERYHTKESVRNPEVKNNYYVNRPEYTNSEMVEAGPNMKTYVYNMFSRVTNYNRMSNMQEGELSLEGVHGTVHIVVGGLTQDREIPGHMTDPAIAGFDPIFFLHHCNVDRLFSLWQAIYPNSYIGSGTPGASTELHPFRKTDNQYWTSTMARDVKAFGYTYPELLKSDVRGQVAVLYGGASPARSVADASNLSRKMKRDGFFVRRQSDGENDNLHTPPSTADLAEQADKIINSTTSASAPQTYNEYVANIKAPNTAADGSYKIYVFLGQPTSEEGDWTKDNNFVGSFDIFAPSGLAAAHQKTVLGSVSLTNAFLNLVASQKVADLKPKTIRAYLKTNLVWKATGQAQGTTQTGNIRIDVLTAKVTVPQGENQLPQWGPFSHVYKAK